MARRLLSPSHTTGPWGKGIGHDADKEGRVRIDVDTIESIQRRESSPGRSQSVVVIIVAPLAAGIAALSSVNVR